MKKYYIITIGCQMNKSDSERISAYLESFGLKKGENEYLSDIVVLTTCGVRQSAEDRAYGLPPTIKKHNPKVKIVLTGCLSNRKDVRKRLAGFVDVWLLISDLPKLGKLLGLGSYNKATKDYLNISSNYNSRFSAFVPIGNGCNNFCTYCVVPYARGREVYRPASDIIREVKKLTENKFKEIILIAQNVNSYHCAKNKAKYDFADLLRNVNDIKGDFWIRFSTSHPKDMSQKLIKTISECDKVCKHIHLPAQAGNNQILKAMNRRYTREQYLNKIGIIRKYIPNASITTDIIVGFPGETKAQFNDTKKLFKQVGYDMAFVSQYSPRPGTGAYTLKDNVLKSEKKKREMELVQITREINQKHNNIYVNKIVRVLVEAINKKGCIIAKTDVNKVVRIKINSKKDEELMGTFQLVKIIRANDLGLEGELQRDKPKVIAILGPTSSGKTGMAVKLAYKYNGEIVSADSRQVYRYMNVGTGKDLHEYVVKGNKIPYHLIDVVHPNTEYSLEIFKKQAQASIDDILSRGKTPIVAGGTGLYLQALVDNYDLVDTKPNKKARLLLEKVSTKAVFKKLRLLDKSIADNLNNSEKNNKRRLIRLIEIANSKNKPGNGTLDSSYDFTLIGLKHPQEKLWSRIYKRIIDRLDKDNMVDEVRDLHDKHKVSWKRLEGFGLEYKYISLYLRGRIDYDEMIEQLFIATRQFAKRQMSWYRRWGKQGAKIHWVDDFNEIIDIVGAHGYMPK